MFKHQKDAEHPILRSQEGTDLFSSVRDHTVRGGVRRERNEQNGGSGGLALGTIFDSAPFRTSENGKRLSVRSNQGEPELKAFILPICH